MLNTKRECGECSMCCKGFLWADVHGHRMDRNNFCHYLSESTKDGCTIYDKRPEFCSMYNCVWKNQPELLPNWMKPNLADVILTEYHYNDIHYFELIEGHEKIRVEVLNFILNLCIKNKINLKYQVDREFFYIGDDNFINEMDEKSKYQF